MDYMYKYITSLANGTGSGYGATSRNGVKIRNCGVTSLKYNDNLYIDDTTKAQLATE